jgi:hypothetical protein
VNMAGLPKLPGLTFTDPTVSVSLHWYLPY